MLWAISDLQEAETAEFQPGRMWVLSVNLWIQIETRFYGVAAVLNADVALYAAFLLFSIKKKNERTKNKQLYMHGEACIKNLFLIFSLIPMHCLILLILSPLSLRFSFLERCIYQILVERIMYVKQQHFANYMNQSKPEKSLQPHCLYLV